jgi:hypothetical protein
LQRYRIGRWNTFPANQQKKGVFPVASVAFKGNLWGFFLNPIINMSKKTYKELYLSMLEIGQERVHEGVSYNQMRETLVRKGYKFDNDCIELAVKQWFYDSFHHTGADDNPFLSVKDLDNHLHCSFILKGESCLKLLDYQTSSNGVRVGFIALFISVVAVAFTIYGILNSH